MTTRLAVEYERRLAVAADAFVSDIIDWLPTLRATVLDYPHAQVIELGVRSGNSTAAVLAAAEQVDGHVWSVDIAQPTVPFWWHESPLWTLHVGDDLSPAIM